RVRARDEQLERLLLVERVVLPVILGPQVLVRQVGRRVQKFIVPRERHPRPLRCHQRAQRAHLGRQADARVRLAVLRQRQRRPRRLSGPARRPAPALAAPPPAPSTSAPPGAHRPRSPPPAAPPPASAASAPAPPPKSPLHPLGAAPRSPPPRPAPPPPPGGSH